MEELDFRFGFRNLPSMGYCSQKILNDKWIIPLITIQTGPVAHAGVEQQWGVKRAVEEINASGGIAGKNIEISLCDTGYDPARAVSCMRNAVKESLIVIGPLSTMDTRSSAGIAVRQKVMCMPAACSPSEVEKAYPWAITFFPNTAKSAATIKQWLGINPDIKSVVIYQDTKNPIWVEYGKAYKKVCEESGIEVLDVIQIDPESVDMGAAVIRGLGKKPNGFVLSSGPMQMARIILELDARGWKEKGAIACQTAAGGESFFKVGGKEVEGVYILSWVFDFSYNKPEWQTFIADYAEDFDGAKPAAWVPIYYDAVYAIKDAFEKLEITGAPDKLKEEREKIKSYLSSSETEFQSIYKPFKSSKEGGLFEMIIMQVKDGEPVRVDNIK